MTKAEIDEVCYAMNVINRCLEKGGVPPELEMILILDNDEGVEIEPGCWLVCRGRNILPQDDSGQDFSDLDEVAA